MKKILVIGSHVAESLARKGQLVRALVRSVKPRAEWDALGIEQIAGDMSNIDSLAAAFAGVDRLFSVTPNVENLVRLGATRLKQPIEQG